MKSRLSVLILSVCVLCRAETFAQTPPPEQIPWQVQLGVRVATAEAARPLVPIVVLVPDAATFAREVGRWSLDGQWPFLIEDDDMAPRFIRAFKPQAIYRVASAEPLPVSAKERETMLASISARSWGAAEDEPVAEAYARLKWKPPGVAITDVNDPAWTAALALSSARGLPLLFLDGDYGPIGKVLVSRETNELEERIQRLVSSTGYSWRSLGDDIDAVALCRVLPSRTILPENAVAKNPKPGKWSGPYALTDALARIDSDQRWGIVGWIWGDEIRSAYMAMSSIFLPRNSLWFFDGYGKSAGREAYEMRKADAAAKEFGYETLVLDGDEGDLDSWLKMIMGGLQADVLFMNSSGQPNYFDLQKGPKGNTVDIPFLQKPLALAMIHSFSLKDPANINTIGGRFLDRGVYAYYGSVEEPFLTSFVPSEYYVRRIAGYVPFLLAGRMWDGPWSKTWRLTAIGDPLMLVQPPVRRRVPIGKAPEIPFTSELRQDTQDSMKRFKALRQEEARPTNIDEVIDDLVGIGRDDIAIQVWGTTRTEEESADAAQGAEAALGPAFRTRSFDEFLRAYRLLPREKQNGDAREMLWHLVGPRLGTLNDASLFALLISQVRDPNVAVDFRRLMPHLDRVLGPGAGRAAVQRALKTTTNTGVQEQLRKLLNS